MTWDYRVVHQHLEGPGYAEELYAIHEVYYDENGAPRLMTENAVCPQGETIEELQEDLVYYARALRLPVLEWDDFHRQEE